MKYVNEMSAEDAAGRQALIAQLEKSVLVGQEYLHLKEMPGFKRWYEEINSATNSLLGSILQEKDTPDLFRMQGKILGLQASILVIDTAIEDAKDAQAQIEEIQGGRENDSLQNN